MSSDNHRHRKLAAIMFTDMVGYSALTQKSEKHALELLAEHNELLRSIFPKFDGAEINTIGDAFFVEFESALAALDCAAAIQCGLIDRNREKPLDDPIRVRIGIHIGDVVHTEDNLLGDGVNIASRLVPFAEPGGICISEDVARQVINKTDYALRQMGPVELKNIELPVEIYTVELPWSKSDAKAKKSNAPVAGKTKITTFKKAAFVGVIVLLILGVWLGYKWLSPQEEHGRYRLGILPFENLMHDSLVAEWPVMIQTMLVGEFTGMDGLAVIHDASLNGLINNSLGNIEAKRDEAYYNVVEMAKPDLIIDGSIVQVSNGVVLQMRLTDPATREVRHTYSVKCESQASLQDAVRSLAREALSYLDNKVFHTDNDTSLKPWTTTRNMTALSSFIQATRLMYSFDPEAERYLNHAIESDPGFVSARIWLVSMLMKRGDTIAARRQVDTLHKFEASANPFELTMIRWADAFIRDDTLAQIHNLSLALEFSPHNNILLFMLARLEYLRQHFQECINALLPAIQMRWPYSPAYYMLAVCYHQLGRNDEAKKVLDMSESIQPTHPGIFMLRMVIALRDGDTVKAGQYESAYIDRMKDAKGKSHRAYCELADICSGEQFYRYALHLYRNAIAEDPANLDYHDKLAWTLAETGDSLAAAGEYGRVETLKKQRSTRGR